MLCGPSFPRSDDLAPMSGSAANSRPNRRRAAAWGILFGYGGAFLAVARNILLVPLYLKFVSLAEYGAWLATGATVIQLLVSDFGLAGVLMQRSAALHGAGDQSRLGLLMGSGMVAGLILSILLLAIGSAAVAWLPGMSGLSPEEGETVTNCLYLAVFAAAVGIIAAITLGLIRSWQRSAEAGSITLSAEIANIAISTALLFYGAGLYALVWGMIARSLLMACASILSLMRLSRSVTFSAEAGEVRTLFADAGTSLVTSLAMKFLAQANTLLVGIFLGPTSAAAYGLTVRAHETLAVFLGQLNAAFTPGMAHLWGSGNAARFRALLLNILSGSALLAGLGIIAVICSNESFVTLWLHRAVFGGQNTSILMGLAVWLSQLGYVAYDALYALGRFRFIARTFVLAALIQVVLLVLLLRMGLWVVPAVTLVTSAFWGGVFWMRVSADVELARPDRNNVLMNLVAIAGCGITVAVVVLSLYSAADTWDGLLIRATCSATAMLVLILALSGRMRGIVHGELRMTVKSFLARDGA